LLLILPAKQRIAAISPVALTQAQAPRAELDRDYRDALLLDRDGTLRRIERIDILGPWGNTLGQRLLNRLTSGWRIEVQLSSPLPLNLDDQKSRLAQYILVNGGVHGRDLNEEPPADELASAVRRAESVAELFEALRMPAPDDALDVL
jgi:hypothetical protein